MWTLDDFRAQGKTVFVRVDINSPLDPETLEILDISRITRVTPTLRELQEKNAKTVIFAHQGRPGSRDFIPLKQHGGLLEQEMGVPVQYVEDIYGDVAQAAIQALQPGEILLLENVRQYEGEQEKKSAEDHAHSPLVSSLAPLGDFFVNDAFAAAHRSHCTLVGFTPVLPSCAGRLLETEIETLTKLISHPAKPSVFILGGAKYGNVLGVLESLWDRGVADTILLAGVPGMVFLDIAQGGIGSDTLPELSPEDVPRIRDILQRYEDRLLLPQDFACEAQGKRREVTLSELPISIPLYDIGTVTISTYSRIIQDAQTIFFSGPPGVFEDEKFQVGTRRLCSSVADSSGFSLIGGGHTVAAFNQFGFLDKVSYVSTGGGALERFIMGASLPVIDALVSSKNLYKDSH